MKPLPINRRYREIKVTGGKMNFVGIKSRVRNTDNKTRGRQKKIKSNARLSKNKDGYLFHHGISITCIICPSEK